MNVVLGLGEHRVGRAAEEKWIMYGLGSCIGLILCDPVNRVSAAAHMVLPKQVNGNDDQPAKYVETAVPFLLEEMAKLGAERRYIYAQAAGGAQMLNLASLGDIGARNAEATRAALQKHGIPLVAERIGGRKGRTLCWDLRTGQATVRRVGSPDEVITPRQYWYGEVRVDGPRVDR